VSSHFLLLLLFSALVSTVFAALLRDRPRDQLRLGARIFAAFVGAAVLLGWLMYPFPI
jgi:heme A synthase